MQETNWERQLVEKVALGALEEQRKARRWGILFKFLMLAYLVWIVFLIIGGTKDAVNLPAGKEGHTAVINVEGMIAGSAKANATDIVDGLIDAFEDPNTKGIILNINSPGGSPVQASEIFDEIISLKQQYPAVKVYAVGGDLCTSAAYYIAAAADKIYVNRSTLVGSIGVLLNGFGFVDTLDKLGAERRLITAGRLKGMLDPFSEVKAEETEIIQAMLANVHDQFIEKIKVGRGEKLKETDDMFSGRFWTGEQAKEIGIVDDFGSVRYVAKEVIGNSNIVDFTKQPDFFERFAERLGTSVAEVVKPDLKLNLAIE